jgi:tetratricopeptide (TPR) repeat protein
MDIEAYGLSTLPPGPRIPAGESMRHASLRWHLIEDHRPLSGSLEFHLSNLHWIREGTLPFSRGEVPFAGNNNGRLSQISAALLFANCEDAAAREGPIVVLELGAGSGLFARYFLDEFRRLCERTSRDFYQRLSFHVTDRSPRTVKQWEELGIFREHADHAIANVCEAGDLPQAVRGRVHAVFCNYLLGVLPAAIVRRAERGWEQIAVRTWIADEAAVLRQYTKLSLDEIRELASSPELQAREQLLPLLPLLEIEAQFIPADPSDLTGLDGLNCSPGDGAFVYNYGAINCLDSVLAILGPDGFVLANDYDASSGAGPGQHPTGQRFGRTTAMGVNFPLLDEYCGRSATVLTPIGEDPRPIESRLLLRGDLPATRRVFNERLASIALQHAAAPGEQARREAAMGQLRQAVASYGTAIERNPQDWVLIGEAAEFVAAQLRDYTVGMELAKEALQLNPWYSPWLWNVLGECLASLKRPEEAHECYLHAHRIHPEDPATNLKLAHSWLVLGDPQRSLEAAATGLANDSNALFRHALLGQQQQAIASLSLRWQAERETSARRRG